MGQFKKRGVMSEESQETRNSHQAQPAARLIIHLSPITCLLFAKSSNKPNHTRHSWLGGGFKMKVQAGIRFTATRFENSIGRIRSTTTFANTEQ